MHLKRFRGQTVAEALDAARAELGPEAVVLGSQLVARAGMRGFFGAREVELTAAIERQVSEDRPARQENRQAGADTADSLSARLRATGLDASIVSEVAGLLGNRRRAVPSAEIRCAIASWAPAIASDDTESARVEVFVGPAGAGKTTTVAKIAARARVEKGRRLGLISTDTFRVGAMEQLRLYAEIIGSPFVGTRTPQELAAVIQAATGTLLIDTAGRSPRDGHAQELMSLLAATPGVRMHLVVPGGASVKDLRRILDAHAAVAPKRVVLTKVDEAESIAPIAGELRSRGLRISYFGTGQRVPEDLQVATPGAVASAIVGDVILDEGCAA